ncbi:MAG TPA: transporter substrate-binding domain-containing protein [Ideonella sp.]|uniref:transporter substrate-binding domain-containing protein n=1 Tax=Ideonella sp. TaxID=1929293 RepID=UPI002C9D9C7E|nr:transporter substrate-binding domain-containing protein [Ideonella sp.]HSI51446.1 transporter substrate-binding domain-containing protein [Ideonella sp.]
MNPLRSRFRCRRAAWLVACCLFADLACAQANGDSPTLRKIRDAGVITLGHRVASAPFSYLDGKRQPIGYSMDICQKVVDAVRVRLQMPDLEVRPIVVSSATRIPLVANGTVDLECGITTNTAERGKSVSFSVTTFVAASRLLARKSAHVQTLDDLRGKPVVSTLATTSLIFLNAVNQSRGLDMKILAGLDDIEAFRLLTNGRAVAYAMDDVLLHSMLADAPDAASYLIANDALTTEPYAIGLKRDDPVFKQLVDGVIVELFKSGEIQGIYRKWFESPIPPKGTNLNLPMSDSLKRVIQHPTDASDPRLYR